MATKTLDAKAQRRKGKAHDMIHEFIHLVEFLCAFASLRREFRAPWRRDE
jgi:hypothetical protein